MGGWDGEGRGWMFGRWMEWHSVAYGACTNTAVQIDREAGRQAGRRDEMRRRMRADA